ncbi:MAG: 1-acyl-sn-glycerol-3-phosphate acyltransferase [Bacteroidaceae bacterium]|nr:1-acyl-sn-glycerol-3-phosphate acyltransferase [Bacteroidaceae bacterium]
MIRILYTIYSLLIAWPLFALVTAVVGILVFLSALFGDKTYVCYYAPKVWGISACVLFLLPVKIEGREKLDPKKSYVFLANHQGYFDIFLVYGFLGHNFKWMMKEYLKKMPFVGIACIASRHIFVGDSISSISKAVTLARETLRGGMSMVIFPEGTRSYDGKMLPFKRGAFMLANEIGLPIVPITINGSFNVFSRKAKLVKWGRLTLTIHDPITEEQRQGKPTKVIMQEVYDIIDSKLEK